MIKLLSWNVNGLRAATAKGAMRTLARLAPDIVCLQEVRASSEHAKDILKRLPYRHVAAARKAGYSGVAIFSRSEPIAWTEGIENRVSDDEARVVAAEYPSLSVVSVYVPNSQRGLPRLAFRLRWDRRFREYLKGLATRKPVVFCGDLNVAHEEIDIARPRDNRMNAGFTDQERRSFGRLLAAGFIDTFRSLHPGEKARYTWWSQARGVRERNVGWRIDYVCISRELQPRLLDSFILSEITGSDHCPVGVVLQGKP